MPKLKPGESQSDYMHRCVPEVKGEGASQDQAVGKCLGMYRHYSGSESVIEKINNILEEGGEKVCPEGKKWCPKCMDCIDIRENPGQGIPTKKGMQEATITGGLPDSGNFVKHGQHYGATASDDDHPTGNILMGRPYVKQEIKTPGGTYRNFFPKDEWQWDEFERAKGMEFIKNYHPSLADDKGLTSIYGKRLFRYSRKQVNPDKAMAKINIARDKNPDATMHGIEDIESDTIQDIQENRRRVMRFDEWLKEQTVAAGGATTTSDVALNLAKGKVDVIGAKQECPEGQKWDSKQLKCVSESNESKIRIALTEAKLDPNIKATVKTNFPTVEEIGSGMNGFYWKVRKGHKNSWKGSGALEKFRYSLTQELASMKEADKLIKQLENKQKSVSEATEKKWVYGTRDNQWHLIWPDDRDFSHGIPQKEFEKLGKEKAKKKYLSPRFVKEATLTTPEKHQLKIAQDTLKMSSPMAKVMGGMSKEEAKAFIEKMKKEGKIK